MTSWAAGQGVRNGHHEPAEGNDVAPVALHVCSCHLMPKVSPEAIVADLYSLVRLSGAEGSRTLTGWNLNPVPLPLGYGPGRPGTPCTGYREAVDVLSRHLAAGSLGSDH